MGPSPALCPAGVVLTIPLHTPSFEKGVQSEGGTKAKFSPDQADAGRDWGQEEKGMTEDEMAGWHH